MRTLRMFTSLSIGLALIVACDSGPEVDRDLTGVVVDAEGAPVAGAAVGIVYRVEGMGFPGDWKEMGPDKPLASIRFVIPEAGTVLLIVLDWDRRLVRTLVDGPMDPGEHEIAWDGTDDVGVPVPPGMYRYLIDYEGEEPVEREMFLYLHEPGELHRARHATTNGLGRFRIDRDLLPLGAELVATNGLGEPIGTFAIAREFRVLGVVEDEAAYVYGAVVTEIPAGSAAGADVRITLGAF